MYLFYLGGLLLPVTPADYTLRDNNQNRTITLVSGNEVNLPQTSGLCEISFSALLPMVNYPFSVYEGGFKDGMFFARSLRSMKENAQPIWFRVLRYARRQSTDIHCVIEELSFKEDALNGGDITCEIVLKQYADYSTRVIDTSTGKIITDIAQRQIPQGIVVEGGDTLWTIAKRYYGDGSRYVDIYNKNAEVIEKAAKDNGQVCSESGRYLYKGTKLIL